MSTSTSTKTPQILILSSAEEAETREINDNFVQLLNERFGSACEVVWHNYHNIGIKLDENQTEVFLLDANTALKDFDAVYFKSYFRYYEQASAIAEYLAEHKVKFVGQELESYIPATKLTQMARLARAKMPIPKTLYMSSHRYAEQYDLVVKELGLPFIFKAIDGSTGDDNFLVRSKEQLAKILKQSAKAHFIAQSFIANDSDLRVLIIGKQIRLIIERRRADDTSHLNNTSQGASASLIDVDSFSPEVRELSLRAAEIMNREVAGVDVMLETGTNKPYILEVNASPQVASGAFEDEKLDIYEEYFLGLVQ